MLIVTNGDAARLVIEASGIAARVLPWRDVLHEGPVPAIDHASLTTLRARAIAAAGWADEARVAASFEARDRTLIDAPPAETIVLWFEPDVYDQLQVLQVIALLADAGRTANVALVEEDAFIGTLSPDDVPSHLARVQPLAAAHVETAKRAWAAFRAPAPDALVDLAARQHAALPHLGAALSRLLDEYPDPTGLPRTEATALGVLREAGPLPLGVVFRRTNAMEPCMFMGDMVFYRRMRDLLAGPRPPLSAEAPSTASAGAWAATVASITASGEAALDGRLDLLSTNGFDRWIGGTHVTRDRAWRWDRGARRMLAPPAA